MNYDMLRLMFNASGKQLWGQKGENNMFICYFFAYIINTIISATDPRFKDDKLELIGAQVADQTPGDFTMLTTLAKH